MNKSKKTKMEAAPASNHTLKARGGATEFKKGATTSNDAYSQLEAEGDHVHAKQDKTASNNQTSLERARKWQQIDLFDIQPLNSDQREHGRPHVAGTPKGPDSCRFGSKMH